MRLPYFHLRVNGSNLTRWKLDFMPCFLPSNFMLIRAKTAYILANPVNVDRFVSVSKIITAVNFDSSSFSCSVKSPWRGFFSSEIECLSADVWLVGNGVCVPEDNLHISSALVVGCGFEMSFYHRTTLRDPRVSKVATGKIVERDRQTKEKVINHALTSQPSHQPTNQPTSQSSNQSL